ISVSIHFRYTSLFRSLALTALEFLIALGFVHHWGILQKGALVNTIYIVLTLLKAYYIVAFFMHLKFEKSSFIVICSIVFIFIVRSEEHTSELQSRENI